MHYNLPDNIDLSALTPTRDALRRERLDDVLSRAMRAHESMDRRLVQLDREIAETSDPTDMQDLADNAEMMARGMDCALMTRALLALDLAAGALVRTGGCPDALASLNKARNLLREGV